MFLETLPTNARQLLDELGKQPLASIFYLAGGSAVALHLGHRISVDLDWFTEQNDYAAETLVQQLEAIGRLQVQQQSRGTLTGLLNDTRVSFFSYPCPLLEPLDELNGFQVANLVDLALMKIIAISQRGTKRDFVDLFFICQNGYRLDELLNLIPTKYRRISYPSYHLLRALTYFEDAIADEPPEMLIPFEWTTAQSYFESEVKKLLREL